MAMANDIISICCGCGSVRDPAGFWDRSADFRRRIPSNRLSHGICSDCVERLYPEIFQLWSERKHGPSPGAWSGAAPRAPAAAPAANP